MFASLWNLEVEQILNSTYLNHGLCQMGTSWTCSQYKTIKALKGRRVTSSSSVRASDANPLQAPKCPQVASRGWPCWPLQASGKQSKTVAFESVPRPKRHRRTDQASRPTGHPTAAALAQEATTGALWRSPCASACCKTFSSKASDLARFDRTSNRG